MISYLYAIFDAAHQAYMQPFFQLSKGIAVRNFTDLVNDSSHPLHKHPSDYCLYEIGSFEDTQGMFVPHKAPVRVGLASEFMHVANRSS